MWRKRKYRKDVLIKRKWMNQVMKTQQKQTKRRNWKKIKEKLEKEDDDIVKVKEKATFYRKLNELKWS